VVFFELIERGAAIFEPSAKLAALDLLVARVVVKRALRNTEIGGGLRVA
jgi:hypothetical protein